MDKRIIISKQTALDITKLTDTVKLIEITDGKTNALALDHTKNIKRFNALLEEIAGERINPLKEEIKRLNALVAPYMAQLKDSEAILKQKMLEYGKIEADLRLKARAEALKNIDPFDVAVDLTEFDKPKMDGMSVRKIKTIEITDESLLPRKYLTANLPLIKKDALRAIKPVEIPGIKIVVTENVAVRK